MCVLTYRGVSAVVKRSDPDPRALSVAPHPGVQSGMDEFDELLTVEEVAALLKVPKSWVYGRTRARGPERIPFIKLGKYLRFQASGVRAFVTRQRQGT